MLQKISQLIKTLVVVPNPDEYELDSLLHLIYNGTTINDIKLALRYFFEKGKSGDIVFPAKSILKTKTVLDKIGGYFTMKVVAQTFFLFGKDGELFEEVFDVFKNDLKSHLGIYL